MRKTNIISFLLFVASSANLLAQTDSLNKAAAQDTTKHQVYEQNPWTDIELTGFRMKPAVIVPQTAMGSKKKSSFWLPLAGGILGGSAITYLLLDEEEMPTPDPGPGPTPVPDSLLVRDDAFTIPCLPPFTIQPLLNDEGSGIRISEIGATGNATVELSGTNALVITAFGPEDTFSFSILVSDSLGNSATNNISITVERPELTAQDDSYSAAFANTVTGNVLTNDQGEQIRVVDFSPPTSGGTVELSDNGQLLFTPAPDFFGTIEFTYLIEDACQQQVSAMVRITIAAPDCNFSAVLTPSAADCGLANGAITTVVMPANDYTFSWSTGASTQNLNDLPPGEYDLTITSNNGVCVDSFSATVEESTFTYILNTNTSAANCTGGGEITLELDTPNGESLVTSLDGPNGEEQFLLAAGTTNLSDLTGIFPGDYTIIVYPENAGETCAQQTVVNVADNTLPIMAVNDNFTTPFETSISGNFLNNDNGQEISLNNVNPPATGTFNHDNGGGFTYTPPANFTGTIVFTYTLLDACGNTTMATVTIEVGAPDCEFEVVLTTTPTNCGLNDGTITSNITPAGAYSYSWSTGANTPSIEQLSPGEYQLTVSSNGGLCSTEVGSSITEITNNYIESAAATPGTCLGGGNIELTLSSPAAGPLVLSVTNGAGTETFLVNAGTLSLNTLTNLPAGNYTLSIYPEAAGIACSQLNSLVIPDNTPPVVANDDFFNTAFQVPVSGNMLPNDQGLQIELAATSNVEGGTLNFAPDGSFTFTPFDNFTGTGGFTYTIQDACGTTAQATVTITVGAPDCDFTLSLNAQGANCGFDNGSVSTTVMPNDDVYTYSWSDGSSNSNLINVPADLYAVTVSSNSGLCNQSFSILVPQLPINYFNNFVTTAGTCAGGGNIQLDLTSPDGGILNGVVNGPAFNQTVSLPNGISNLNEIFNLVPGTYSITLYPQAAGPACLQTIEVSIPDNTPPLAANADNYTTPWQTSVSGNLLDNDSGLNISLLSIEEVTGGSITFAPSGTFTFTPADGFTGEASFIYSIQDDCANTTQAEVTIIVGAPDCEFAVALSVVPATCELSSGSISTSIDPPGAYSYSWSTGATTPSIENLPSADYTLTVTSNGGFCQQNFMATVTEAEAQFVDSLSTAPGDCAGNGSIIIEAYAPDNGNLNVIINGPSGSTEVTIPSGFSDLGDLVNLPSGVYDLVVYPESVGFSCNEATFAEITDNTPPFIVNNDDYSTPFQTPLIDNVLENDEGLLVQAVEVIEATGGTVDLSSNGDFLFTPTDGATGTASFVYSAMDACTAIQQATVTITIGEPDCNFSTTFTQTNVSCGFNDGSIIAMVSPAGDNYTYAWSNGSDTTQALNLPAGEHSLTITDNNDNCPLSYTFTLTELPAAYFSNLQVTPPTCSQAADIAFTLSGNAPGLFTLLITDPGGNASEVSNISGGPVQLSNYLLVNSGTYEISAYNQNIGTSCTDTTSALVPELLTPVINLTGITQPSGSGATDGSFTFSFDQLSAGPYQVTINGQLAGSTAGEPFTASNLGAGTYDAFVTDADGCTSNTINVELVSNFNLQVGWQQTMFFFTESLRERALTPTFRPQILRWRPALIATLPHRNYSYQLEITEAAIYTAEGRVKPALLTRLHLGQQRQNNLGEWVWSTGLAYLNDDQLGWQWETQLGWTPPEVSNWNLQLRGVMGRQKYLQIGLNWIPESIPEAGVKLAH